MNDLHKDIVKKLLCEYLDPPSFSNLIQTCKQLYNLRMHNKTYQRISDTLNRIYLEKDNVKQIQIINKLIYGELAPHKSHNKEESNKKLAMILSAECSNVKWFHWFRKNIKYKNSGITNAEFESGLEIAITKSNNIDLVKFIERKVSKFLTLRLNDTLCFILRNALICNSNQIINYLQYKCEIGYMTVGTIIKCQRIDYFETMAKKELIRITPIIFQESLSVENREFLEFTLKFENIEYTRRNMTQKIAEYLVYKRNDITFDFFNYLYDRLNLTDLEILRIIYLLICSLSSHPKFTCDLNTIKYVYSKVKDPQCKSVEYLRAFNHLGDIMDEFNYSYPWLNIQLNEIFKVK